MSALMSDVLEGKIAPERASVAIKAGSQLLRITDMQLRYQATAGKDGKKMVLMLTSGKR